MWRAVWSSARRRSSALAGFDLAGVVPEQRELVLRGEGEQRLERIADAVEEVGSAPFPADVGLFEVGGEHRVALELDGGGDVGGTQVAGAAGGVHRGPQIAVLGGHVGGGHPARGVIAGQLGGAQHLAHALPAATDRGQGAPAGLTHGGVVGGGGQGAFDQAEHVDPVHAGDATELGVDSLGVGGGVVHGGVEQVAGGHRSARPQVGVREVDPHEVLPAFGAADGGLEQLHGLAPGLVALGIGAGLGLWALQAGDLHERPSAGGRIGRARERGGELPAEALIADRDQPVDHGHPFGVGLHQAHQGLPGASIPGWHVASEQAGDRGHVERRMQFAELAGGLLVLAEAPEHHRAHHPRVVVGQIQHADRATGGCVSLGEHQDLARLAGVGEPSGGSVDGQHVPVRREREGAPGRVHRTVEDQPGRAFDGGAHGRDRDQPFVGFHGDAFGDRDARGQPRRQPGREQIGDRAPQGGPRAREAFGFGVPDLDREGVHAVEAFDPDDQIADHPREG
jgi:hypothetical protein